MIQLLRAFKIALVYHDGIFVEYSDRRRLHFWCFLKLLVLNIEYMSNATPDVDIFILLNGWSALLLIVMLVLIVDEDLCDLL